METERDIVGDFFQYDAVPLTKGWPLVDDPRYMLTIMVTYVSLIVLGKRFMRDRPAFNIKPIMLVHNFGLVVLSAIMFMKFFTCSIMRVGFDPSFFCELADETIPCHYGLATGMWLWYISKMIDLLDTSYHVLRKRPVSFLHGYHHTSVVFLSWVLVRYLPAGSSVFGPMLNSFVHTIMYFYYGLSTIGPHMQKYLWWKKYLTKLQMTQFVLLFSYTIFGHFYHSYVDCYYPPRLVGMQVLYCISLFTLFANFYYQSYIKKRSKAVNGHDKKNGVNGASECSNGVDISRAMGCKSE